MRKGAAARGVGEAGEREFRVKNRAVRLHRVTTADVGVCWREGRWRPGGGGRSHDSFGCSALATQRLSPGCKPQTERLIISITVSQCGTQRSRCVQPAVIKSSPIKSRRCMEQVHSCLVHSHSQFYTGFDFCFFTLT